MSPEATAKAMNFCEEIKSVASEMQGQMVAVEGIDNEQSTSNFSNQFEAIKRIANLGQKAIDPAT